MNPRTTLILAVLVAALGAFIWWTELREGASDPEALARALFPEIEATAIEALELRTSDDVQARLVRAEGGWRLEQPLSFTADAVAVDGVASSVATLESEAVFDEPEPLDAYGLDVEPAVSFEAGGERHALRIGDKTPVGGNTYVAIEGDARVFAVATWRMNALRKSLMDLRERRILDFAPGQVRTLRASWPGGAVALERGEGDDGWRLVEPLEARASADTVEGLLATVQFLRASGFVDEPMEDAEAGLESPAFELELGLYEGEPLRMLLGETRDGSKRLVRGPAAGVLYEVEAARLSDLPTRVADYRYRTLSQFASDDARRFEIAFHEGESVTGTRSDAGWETAPTAMAAGAAARLVQELADLEAEDIAAESLGAAELAGFELSPPRVELRVFGGAEGAEESQLASVRLGKADLERGIAAQSEGDPVVYWLPFDLAEHLPVSLEAFQNRFASQEGEEGEDADVEGAGDAEALDDAMSFEVDQAP